MRGIHRGRAITALLSVLIAAALAAPATTASAAARTAQDPVPIGPNQFFSGFINNAPPGAVQIKVVCPGVAQTGHPVGHQPVEVKPASGTGTTDVGFTGSKGKKITGTLGPTASTLVLGTFTSYFVNKAIPTNITVPCSGSGTALFIPSPTSKTAKAAALPVTFVNIGT